MKKKIGTAPSRIGTLDLGQRITLATAVIAAVVALLSFVVAVHGFALSKEALEIAQQDFADSRSIVWTSIFNDTDQRLELNPTDESLTVQEVRLYWPDDNLFLNVDSLPGVDGTLALSTQALHRVASTFEAPPARVDLKPTEGHYRVLLPSVDLPFVIQTHFIALNRPQFDRTLYRVRVPSPQHVHVHSFEDSRPLTVRPEVQPIAIVFVRRLRDTEDAPIVVAHAWLATLRDAPR